MVFKMLYSTIVYTQYEFAKKIIFKKKLYCGYTEKNK